jgi:hypothetical protein
VTPRSISQNALYWRTLERVLEAYPGRWGTPQELHAALKIAAGYHEPVTLLTGRRVIVPRSIAFEAMTQPEAQQFYDAAFQILADHGLLPPEEAAPG